MNASIIWTNYTHVPDSNPLEQERLRQLLLRAEKGERREVRAGTARRGTRAHVGRREVRSA